MSAFQPNSSSDRMRHKKNMLLYKEELRKPTPYGNNPIYQFRTQLTEGKSQLYIACKNLQECVVLPSISGTLEYILLVNQPVTTQDILNHIPVLNTFQSFTYTVDVLDYYPSYTVRIHYKFINNDSSDGLSFYPVYTWYNTHCSSVTIVSFGNIPLAREGNQFYSMENVSISATAPTILPYTTGYQMFYQCIHFSPIQLEWNMSFLTSMERMFYGCTELNPVSLDWDVRNVTSMSEMFMNCTSFNPSSFSLTNTSVVTMKRMFKGCTSFNTDIRSWTVYSATDMREMFSGCTSCTLNLSQWSVSIATLRSDFSLNTSIILPNVWV